MGPEYCKKKKIQSKQARAVPLTVIVCQAVGIPFNARHFHDQTAAKGEVTGRMENTMVKRGGVFFAAGRLQVGAFQGTLQRSSVL